MAVVQTFHGSRRITNPLTRLLRLMDPQENGCWYWTGTKSSNGYGSFSMPGSIRLGVHRAAYELMVGPIPMELTIDHLCQVKHCVNPDHMEPVTMAENLSRIGKRRTHCKRGHEFTPENTGRQQSGRYCRECRKAIFARWYYKNRGTA